MSWAIDFDLPYIADYVFGTILIAAGLIAVVVTLLISLQRKRSRPAGNPHYAHDYNNGFGRP
jgi:hypothetical protein